MLAGSSALASSWHFELPAEDTALWIRQDNTLTSVDSQVGVRSAPLLSTMANTEMRGCTAT